MKDETLFSFLMISLISVIIISVSICNKENNNQDEPDTLTYIGGSGEIAEWGGTVKIEDEDSPINGASIENPEGALYEAIEIIIEERSNIEIAGLIEVNVLKFLPKGPHFSGKVETALPWSNENQTAENINAYFFDEESSMLKQLKLKNIDTEKELVKANTQRFIGNFSYDNKNKSMVESHYYSQLNAKYF